MGRNKKKLINDDEIIDEELDEELAENEVPKKAKAATSESEAELLRMIINNQRDLSQRLDDMEQKATSQNSQALLRMVNFLYDTDDKHISELTRIPLNAVRPFALGMALESILDPNYDSSVPLSQVVRNNYMRLMRSVGGVHLGRGLRLAEEQAQAAAEEAEEMELGGGDG